MLVRWNPVEDLYTLNRMLDGLWNGGTRFALDTSGPAMDLTETEDALVLTAELPGFSPEQIDIKIENGVLHLKGAQQDEAVKGQYYLRERSLLNFKRSLTLPLPVNADKAEAQFENGVLTLRMPKAEEALPRRIPIVPKQEITAHSPSQN